MLKPIQMRWARRLLAGLLILFVGSGALLWYFYDSMPWVGTHLRYASKEDGGGFNIKLDLAEGRAVQGGKGSLQQVPPPNRTAGLSASLAVEMQPSGSEYLQRLRLKQVQSVQYSWEQKENKNLLGSVYENRVGSAGGLLSVTCKPELSNLWQRSDVASAWILPLWPTFPWKGLKAKDSWTSETPFQVVSREVGKPFFGRWNCNWTFREEPQDADHRLAILDLDASASSADQPLEGRVRAEIAYSMDERRIMAYRGAFQLKMAATAQATEQDAVTLLDVVQGRFQVLRIVQGPARSAATPVPLMTP